MLTKNEASKIFILWANTTDDYCLTEDIILPDYEGFRVMLHCPNGGILGGTICESENPNEYWYYDIEALDLPIQIEIDLYSDITAHTFFCHKKIDDLIEERNAHPSETINATQLNLFTNYSTT